MINTGIYNTSYRLIKYKSFDAPYYDPNRPKFKNIIWNNYDWLEKLDESGKARPVILDNIQRTLLCKTLYLGYDAFDCNNCDNWIWVFRHYHSRFCSSCGIKLQKNTCKMIIHIPDKSFKTTRYYGFYNNKCNDILDVINELLGKQNKYYTNKIQRKQILKEKLNKLKFRTQIMDTYNRDIFKCKCGGNFEYIFSYNPLEGGSNDRQYRKNCIDEMRMLWLSRGSPTRDAA